MYDRDTAMLEMYDISVKSIRKVRGGWLCMAEDGLYVWRETDAGEERLRLEAELCQAAETAGMTELWQSSGGVGSLRMDHFIKNREEHYLTSDRFGRRFVLKEWTDGRECEVRKEEDLYMGARACACMHRAFQGVSAGELSIGSLKTAEPFFELWSRRKRELIRVQRYVQRRRNKNELEQLIMKKTPIYLEQAEWAMEMLNRVSDQIDNKICHGDFHYHNLIFDKNESWICCSSRIHMGPQIGDFYLFLRKCMEKHSWNWQLAETLLTIYCKINPISEAERQLLYCLFLFPEKYWKQINFYIQSNKAWVPEKNVRKLVQVIRQEEKRQNFLAHLNRFILHPEQNLLYGTSVYTT